MVIIHDPRCIDYGSSMRPEQPARITRSAAHLQWRPSRSGLGAFRQPSSPTKPCCWLTLRPTWKRLTQHRDSRRRHSHTSPTSRTTPAAPSAPLLAAVRNPPSPANVPSPSCACPAITRLLRPSHGLLLPQPTSQSPLSPPAPVKPTGSLSGISTPTMAMAPRPSPTTRGGAALHFRPPIPLATPARALSKSFDNCLNWPRGPAHPADKAHGWRAARVARCRPSPSAPTFISRFRRLP